MGLDEAEHATPLTSEERQGLVPSHITLRSELNELEQQNILEAATWASMRRRDPMGEPFGRNLHRRMFSDVWKWAGAYRTSGKNLGVDWPLIQPRMHEALEQTRYWIENKTLPPDDIAEVSPHSCLHTSLPQWKWALVASDG